ncbi:hypothetical protein D8B26_003440 [Coccidioides posadasii str. Silveira]|uniref:Uncharacterized protein n=2 Tax=Coccidioides posadasii TaxID=199306 RepID=E9CZK5_COCPS|nr:conserved hypothetical protein [Coccidioides posadasii str. Silveira]KMM73325.1 hypothetical protein CPAG_09614 [Coccidioides posadasii RMSCC 3488]QVM08763.1 hypothetical protein D8B26_003440 [Coccidioides posadasii str. Silveira]
MPIVAPLIGGIFTLVGLGGEVIDTGAAGPPPRHIPRYVNPRATFDTENIPRVKIRRPEVGPCNVPKYNFEICRDQINKQPEKIVSSNPSEGVVRFEKVPPGCMNLATVLTSSCGDAVYPFPCGSDCLQYTGLTDNQMQQIFEALSKA